MRPLHTVQGCWWTIGAAPGQLHLIPKYIIYLCTQILVSLEACVFIDLVLHVAPWLRGTIFGVRDMCAVSASRVRILGCMSGG